MIKRKAGAGPDEATTSRRAGEAAEVLAAKFLQRRGLRLVRKNYRCRLGEIDLIMRDGELLVFVEVRYRRCTGYGSGEETVSRRKQRRIIQTAEAYIRELQRKPGELPACRFDIVSITGALADAPEITCLTDAFRVT